MDNIFVPANHINSVRLSSSNLDRIAASASPTPSHMLSPDALQDFVQSSAAGLYMAARQGKVPRHALKGKRGRRGTPNLHDSLSIADTMRQPQVRPRLLSLFVCRPHVARESLPCMLAPANGMQQGQVVRRAGTQACRPPRA